MKFTVKEVKQWKNGRAAVTDDYGNYMMSLTFEEHNNEPVDYRSKNVPNEGDVLDGRILSYTTRGGNERIKFELEKMSIQEQRIMARWGVERALELAPDHTDLDKIYELADAYTQLVEKLIKE